MSGSSMDGVDLAHCTLTENNGKWSYTINQAVTIPYDENWRIRLSQLRSQGSLIYVKTDVFYGRYLGEKVNEFIKEYNLQTDLIASHGHTVFHYPNEWITAQVGDGSTISAITNLPVVSDFRRMDLAKGGEGAPLVSIGDELMFNEYDFCLNLGGFANISGTVNGIRIAYDLSPCNIVLNRVARDTGKSYDEDGKIAEMGSINYELLNKLNEIDWYKKPYPKSLNRDWINKEMWHLVRDFDDMKSEDRMKTLVDHIAVQVANSLESLAGGDATGKKVLVTGGGAFNKTLIDHLRSHTDATFVVPDNSLVNYKEALIFALLGILRAKNMVNIQKAGTGASSDSVSGALSGNFSKIN